MVQSQFGHRPPLRQVQEAYVDISTATYTAKAGDRVIGVNRAGTVTITLPTGELRRGRIYTVKDESEATTGQGTDDYHAQAHNSGGADALKLDDLATPDDNTDLDFSTSAHGLVPKGHTTEATTTSLTATDLLTISSLSVAGAVPIWVLAAVRRSSSGSAGLPVMGLKLDTTVIQEALLANQSNSFWDGQNSASAANGMMDVVIGPRLTNYDEGVIATQFNSGDGSGDNSSGSGPILKPTLDAVMPIATVTDITIRAISVDTTNPDPTLAADEAHVYSLANS